MELRALEDLRYLEALASSNNKRLEFEVGSCGPEYQKLYRESERYDKVLNEPLGPVLFKLFLQKSSSRHLLGFQEDVLFYEQLPWNKYKENLARKIISKYISPNSKSRVALFSTTVLDVQENSKRISQRNCDELFESAKLEVQRDLMLCVFPQFLESRFYERLLEFRFRELQVVSRQDFQFLRILGEGGFGRVIAVCKKDTGTMYACKLISKDKVLKKKRQKFIQNERNILSKCSSPFIVSLHYAFQDQNSLYLMMDLVSGGEIRYHLKTIKQFPEDWVRFYAAQLVLALEHLHQRDIVYRDLKPENILITSSGHIQLTDLSLSSYMNGKSLKDHCGTRSYMAPEQSYGTYGKEVDWWSLGVIVYVMLYGRNPFKRPKIKDSSRMSASLKSLTGISFVKWGSSVKSRSFSPMRVAGSPRRSPGASSPIRLTETKEQKRKRDRDQKVAELVDFYKERFHNLKYPQDVSVSTEALSFMKDLLVIDAEKRLGFHGVDQIKQHVFFKGIDWNRMAKKHIAPPFIPNVETVNADYVSGVAMKHQTPAKKEHFPGFDYIRRNVFQDEVRNSIYDLNFLCPSGKD